MGRRRPDAENVTAFKADSEFLGAEDIMGRGDVRIRIVRVITYPKGYMVGGRPAKRAFPVVEYEVLHNGEWQLGKKRWIVSSAEVRRALIVRAVSVHAQDWRGMEIDLFAEVCRSPQGGWTWGTRVRPIPSELKEESLTALMQQAADRVPPDQRDIKPDNETTTEDDHADADLGG